MNTSRRLFLKSGALALASVGFAPGFGPKFLRSTVFADEPNRASRATGGRKVLVCIFQRGAVDGLSMVVPHGDPSYYEHRTVTAGGIAIPRTGPGSVIDLDGTFGLHPSLAALKPIYDAGFLAPIQAVGSPNATRSHFDAQDFMESAMPGDRNSQDGWLTRTLRYCPEDARKDTLRAIAMTSNLPRSLEGDPDVLALADMRSFGLGAGLPAGGRKGRPGRASAPIPMSADPTSGFEAMYDGAVGDVLHGAGAETFDALKLLRTIKPDAYVPATNAKYPNGQLGNSLKQIAQLIKADVGLEVAFAEVSGWDTHVAQGGSQGALSRRLLDLGQAMAAFHNDMGDGMSNVVVLTMSEFGRTVHQNGNGGTDHGHANCFFAMGGEVGGGKVLGQWPGLATENLYQSRDLAVTTDFRDVFGEVAARHLGVKDLASVFPNYQTGPDRFRNVVKA